MLRRFSLVTIVAAGFLLISTSDRAAHGQEKPQDKKAATKLPPEPYSPHPDSKPRDGVPKGHLTKQPEWKSTIFANTVRDWWVYVPSQYKVDGPPACVMVFQDGSGYINPPCNVPVVFDNLIHAGEMPVTVGVFVNPGHDASRTRRGNTASNRSFEYDTLSDQYARFLLEEILPAVEKQGIKLRKDPASRAIGGRSSGGICAWTVAWEKPDQFGKVWSAIGSFTNIRGGDRYPGVIRRAEKKDIRICFQDGENDLDNQAGNWWLSNLQMEKALAFKSYDHKFIRGVGRHSNAQEAAVLPDALRWLWRDHKATAEK
jgi:enterochelin esterase family protein